MSGSRGYFIACLVVLLSACQTTQEAALPPADLPPMALPAPLPAGTVVVWKGIPSGGTAKSIVVSDDARELTISNEDGTCVRTTSKELFPNQLYTSWQNCTSWPSNRVSGSRELKQISGALWSLKDGNKMTFRAQGRNAGGATWDVDTICTVSTVAGLEVAVGRLDAYKAVCEDPFYASTWYLAPGYAMPVKLSLYDKQRGNIVSTSELVSVGGK